MTYRRRNYRKKRTYRKSKVTDSQALLHLGSRGIQILKRMLGLNTEQHWVDTVETAVALTTTAADMAYALTIPVDDTANGRNGLTVRLTSYTCTINIRAGTVGNTTRVLFVKYKDTRGTTPTSAACLDAPTRITSPYNMGDAVAASGYTVLFDRSYALAAAGQDGDRKIVKFKYTPLNHHLSWTSANTTGVASAMSDGYIIGYIYTDNVGTSADYSANHRIKFVDN